MSTLAEIAAEKAAIIRPGVTTIVAPQQDEALEVIKGRCDEVGVKARFVSAPTNVTVAEDPAPGLCARRLKHETTDTRTSASGCAAATRRLMRQRPWYLRKV